MASAPPTPVTGPAAEAGEPQDARAEAVTRRCLDCGAPLEGKYCFACGQEDQPLRKSLKDLSRELVQHPLIDTKLWKSFVPLMLHPGFLTREYLEGRRTRFIRPIRLYLAISVIFFALFALIGPKEFVVKVNIGETPEQAALRPDNRVSFPAPLHSLEERINRKMAALESQGAEAAKRALTAKFFGWIPRMVFILLPVAALLLKVFWRKRFYIEHLVCSLHLHAFAFTALIVSLLIPWRGVWVALAVWSSCYLAVALRRVYQQGWTATVLKTAGLVLAYLMVMTLAMTVTIFGAILTA